MKTGAGCSKIRRRGMAVASLLLVSGAVFASNAGAGDANGLAADEASPSGEPSGSPEASASATVDGFPGGEVQDVREQD